MRCTGPACDSRRQEVHAVRYWSYPSIAIPCTKWHFCCICIFICICILSTFVESDSHVLFVHRIERTAVDQINKNSPQLSDYEKQRLERKRENAAMLAALGLTADEQTEDPLHDDDDGLDDNEDLFADLADGEIFDTDDLHQSKAKTGLEDLSADLLEEASCLVSLPHWLALPVVLLFLCVCCLVDVFVYHLVCIRTDLVRLLATGGRCCSVCLGIRSSATTRSGW